MYRRQRQRKASYNKRYRGYLKMGYKKEKNYFCGWCKHSFKAVAKGTGGGTNNRGIKLSCLSNTITCPKCHNNLKTWADKEERQITQLSNKG